MSPLLTQQTIAAGPALKLFVKVSGWYRVSGSALIAAGLPPATDPRTLQLFVDGVEQPVSVTAEGGFAVEFYGTASDSPYSDARVYWLVAGSGYGLRVPRVLSNSDGATGSPSFPFTVEKRDRSIYFAALLNGDAENFFGNVVGSDGVDERIDVQHVYASGGGAALEIALQGVTEAESDGNHQVDVLLNGAPVGQLVFTGRQRLARTFPVPTTAVREGENTVTLVARGGEGDVSLVDVIRLTYPRSYTAAGDALQFTATGQQSLSVDGFTGSVIKVIDITEPARLVEVAGAVSSSAGGYRVTFQVPGSGTRTLIAFTDGNMLPPSSVEANTPSAWHGSGNGADHVILSHREFSGAMGPLKTLRENQGLAVKIIDLDDLYDEFTFGQKRPEAIRDFLSRAHSTWSKAPRFVLLVGNASTDPRNYLGTGQVDYAPTRLVATSVLETASDDWFADADGDGRPELAMVGRLPARSAADAMAMVNKIVAYEGGEAGAWSRSVALVADASGPGDSDFAAASGQLRRFIPSEYSVGDIFRGQLGTDAARSALLNAINDGRAIVNYTGHGSVDTWQGNLLTTTDAPAFTNGARLPVFIMMNCLNGFFQGIFPEESLGEALIRAGDGGAVAVWASSGFTNPGNQAPLNSAFFRELFTGGRRTLGEVIAAAKGQASDADVRRTWVLFGDPATRLKGLP